MKNTLQKILSFASMLLLAASLLFVSITAFPDIFGASNEQAFAVASDSYEQRSSGDGDTYYHFNPAKIFDSSGKSEADGGIMGGFVGIIEFIITKILLPLGIVLSTWRVVYIAIFMMILNMDPLQFGSNPRYSNAVGKTDSQAEAETVFNNRARTFGKVLPQNDMGGGHAPMQIAHSSVDLNVGQQKYSDAPGYLKEELKFMLFGLIITFVAWGLVELMLKISVFFLNVADTTSASITN